MEDLGKIKDRIAKLLRMAADSSSPNEAAIAAQRARALMDKYQLDLMDINQDQKEAFISSAAGRFYAAIPEYMNWFATAVAKYNDCQHVFEFGKVDYKKRPGDAKKWGKRSTFRGYESDVQLAIQMFQQLNEAVNRLCKVWMDEKGYTSYSVRVGGQFKHGAFQIIADRLSEMTKERDALVSSTGTALVVVKQQAVSEYFGSVDYKRLKKRELQEADDFEARRAGHVAGRTVEIVKSVEE
jgi:hypothetical protein